MRGLACQGAIVSKHMGGKTARCQANHVVANAQPFHSFADGRDAPGALEAQLRSRESAFETRIAQQVYRLGHVLEIEWRGHELDFHLVRTRKGKGRGAETAIVH